MYKSKIFIVLVYIILFELIIFVPAMSVFWAMKTIKANNLEATRAMFSEICKGGEGEQIQECFDIVRDKFFLP